MALKYWFCSFFILFLLSQTVPADWTLRNDDWLFYHAKCRALYRKSSSVTAVGFDRIAKALNTSGYEIMSKLLTKYLRYHIRPYCEDFLVFIDRHNKFTIYSDHNKNNSVTLFVPRDGAMRFSQMISLSLQIVTSRVDKEAFETGSLSAGMILKSINCKPLVINEASANGSVIIDDAKVTDWNIYDDGHVFVHGTDDFFNCGDGDYFLDHRPPRMNTDEFEVA